MASWPIDPYYDVRNTARPTRARFDYQDECIAQRCIANLLSESVTAVVIEWSTDYIALLPDDNPELVSIKHRDPGQGDWTTSMLKPVVQDLHRVWREMHERCRCSFASNAAITTDAAKAISTKLGEFLDVDADEIARFGQVLAMPDPPLPRRSEITAVGLRDMAGALSLLDLDPRYSQECYRALVARIASVATEEPDPSERHIARLTGSLRAVNDRSRPRLDEQTLRIADLRDLVIATHEQQVRRPPPVVRARQHLRPVTVVARDDGQWYGGVEVRIGTDSYLVHAPVETTVPPDGSYFEQRAPARRLDTPQRDVRLTRFDVRRPGWTADERRSQIQAEMLLHASIPGLPSVLVQMDNDLQLAVVTAMPDGSPLPAVFGLPPYPGMVLDALLRALPTVGDSLGALHAAGRAHRALHPDVFMCAGDRLRLRDVGLATVPAVAGEGRPDYRAPEQDRPILQPPGPATDVYQLAAIVYHLAVGQRPGADAAPPSLLRPELAPSLDTSLLAALVPTPDDRPSLPGLLKALSGVLRSGGTGAC